MLRRGLALTCGSVVVVTVFSALRAPAGGPTVPVLVAARQLAAGEVASTGSIRVAQWPAALSPTGALGSADRAVGHRLATALGPGEPITEHRLSSGALLSGQPAGSVAVHVMLADPGTVEMLGPGDRVDLVGPQGMVARGVVVLRADLPSGGAATGLLPGQRSNTVPGVGTGIVVAAGHDTAEAIARLPLDALGRSALTVLLRSG